MPKSVRLLSLLHNLTIYDNCILNITRKYIGTSHKLPVARTTRVPNKLVQISLLTKQYINKIKYERISQTHLVYLLFIVELATCLDPAGSSSGLYVNQVMLKKCVHLVHINA